MVIVRPKLAAIALLLTPTLCLDWTAIGAEAPLDCTPVPTGFAYHFYTQSYGSSGGLLAGWEARSDDISVLCAGSPEE